MGSRSRERSNKIKEINKNISKVVLKNCPISPRKVRLVLDLIRNKNVQDSLLVLKHTNKEASMFIKKLLLSGISTWQSKNKDKDIDKSEVYISSVFAGEGVMLKRIKPAPQGRAHRIRKRRSHITLILDSKI